MTLYEFTIDIAPITKKNSQQILINRATGKPFIAPSKRYKQYEKDCGWFMPKLKEPITDKVNVRAYYYMPTRRKVDITNLHEALHDILVSYGVVADDNSSIICATDGSRVRYSKEHPRTEVLIETFAEE